VLVRDDIAVQSIGFRRYLPLGTPEIAIAYLDRWGIDEIVILHLDATAAGWSPSAERVKSYSRGCQVPLSIGGGLATIADVKRVIQAGADKVVINTAILGNSEIITKSAALFGSQCIVASIDARRGQDGALVAWTNSGTKSTGIAPRELAIRAETLGAGEILLTSIDHDGSKQGYDIELIRSVVDAVEIPVIVCGGAGHPAHVVEALRCGASAVAAGNFFHFTEHSVIVLKQYLRSSGEPIRLDSYATYEGFQHDHTGRVAKRPDHLLEALRFRYVPEEVI
jgi:cyclase